MHALASAEPPPSFLEIHTWVLRTLDDLAWMRASLHRVLTGSSRKPDRSLAEIPERMCLVADELASNALRHEHSPTVVRLLSDGREFIIDVADAGSYGNTDTWLDDELGLTLTRRMSQDVGWFQTWNTTKHVWARFDVPAWRGISAA